MKICGCICVCHPASVYSVACLVCFSGLLWMIWNELEIAGIILVQFPGQGAGSCQVEWIEYRAADWKYVCMCGDRG